MLSPELQRRNKRLGLALFALFVALFVGACVIALLYLQVDWRVGEVVLTVSFVPPRGRG